MSRLLSGQFAGPSSCSVLRSHNHIGHHTEHAARRKTAHTCRATTKNSKPLTISAPVMVQSLNGAKSENAEVPRWETFCNHSSGEWIGQYSAYTPWEGQPEPVWVDEKGTYLETVYSRAVEQREVESTEEGILDLMVRRLARATTLEKVREVVVPMDIMDDDEGKDVGVDVEGFGFNANGVVVFDGGSYSAGPEFIGDPLAFMDGDEGELGSDPSTPSMASSSSSTAAASPRHDQSGPSTPAVPTTERTAAPTAATTSSTSAVHSSSSSSSNGTVGSSGGADDDDDDGGLRGLDDEGAAEEGEEGGGGPSQSTTCIVEQCLAWSGGNRVRVKLTIKTAQEPGEELDVEVLRLLVFKEHWQGPVGLKSVKINPKQQLDLPLPSLPRPLESQVAGVWKVFTITARPVEEEDPESGEPGTVWVYSSRALSQRWQLPSKKQVHDAGATLWLPGGVLVTVKMVGKDEPKTTKGFGGGKGGKARAQVEEVREARGLCLGLACFPQPGTVASVEREYDPQGFLKEIRYSTAVSQS